jgi:hypothetical protein
MTAGFYSYVTHMTQGFDERTPDVSAVASQKGFPSSFPYSSWIDQGARYTQYMNWMTGKALTEYTDEDEEGNPIEMYPLHMNEVRNFARKRTALLFGEAPDVSTPMVRTTVAPKLPLTGESPSEEDKKLANLAQNIINEIWQHSNGRAIQYEAGILQQVLGGCVFQIRYEPDRADELMVPVTIKMWPASFFLPVSWTAGDPWDLDEAYLAYKITPAEAKRMLGKEIETNITYVEHWTRSKFSVYLDGEIVTATDQEGETVRQENVENPFGFIPFVYIPSTREGNYYGSSLVEDVAALVKEYNARMADMGDAVQDTVDRRRYAVNVHTHTVRTLGKNTEVIDLGSETPVMNHPPSVTAEDPPKFSESVANHVDSLWQQLLREANLGNMTFGEDEGSQRSALTLAIRMWPSTAFARAQRVFWDVGLRHIAIMCLKIVSIKISEGSSLFEGIKIPKDFMKRMAFASDWHPQIPRDREQLVNEIILRGQAGQLSIESALELFGDIRHVDDEKKKIEEDLKFKAMLGSTPNSAQQEGAPTLIEEPIATSGLSETQ